MYGTMKFSIISAAAISAASAHTIFVQLESNGVTNGVSYGIRTPTYDGPITDVSSNALACNGGPNPTTPSNKIIDVKAGSTVTAIWRHTLTSGADDVMDPSHLGPTMAYLKKVGDATSDVGYGNGWFKIQEDGYTNGAWGTSKVINNAGKHAIKIPDCLADGQYLLRAEMIALHGASSSQGAQLYMECAQINISGGTAKVSPATYSIPGIYKVGTRLSYPQRQSSNRFPGKRPWLVDQHLSNDIVEQIHYSRYNGSRKTLGPSVFTCNGNSGSSPATTTTTLATSTKTSGSGSSPTCSVSQWAQCGGSGYSGCTSCASPYTCKKQVETDVHGISQNDYYSQCS
ncbi:hypothetical protein RRF57_000795 [Xylaria bambusicola]|uniref:lytic cellulose monooxygenase (C4-dehydrogenating) n=1 Tax=Xylaria bambusicola TaxID=326684 RepID=A0AAN7UF71_9PEZI